MVTGTAMFTTAVKKVLAASFDRPSCGAAVDGTGLGASMGALSIGFDELFSSHPFLPSWNRVS